jgi:hypothetical protein
MMGSWMDDLGQQMWAVLDALGYEAKQQGWLTLLRPVAPFNRPDFLAPVVTIGALVSFLLLSGVAIVSLGTLLTAMLALYLLLVQVFGVSIELHPFGAR